MIEEKIKFIRIAEKLTQKDLANHLGVSIRNIQKYENRVSKVGGEFILKLCNAFPEYAYWLTTGQTQVEAGHISPEIKISQKEQISVFDAKSV